MDPAVTVTGHSSGIAVPSRRSPARHRVVTVPTAPAPLRQSRVEMSKIDLWSALKMSLCFYLAGLALLHRDRSRGLAAARRVGRRSATSRSSWATS